MGRQKSIVLIAIRPEHCNPHSRVQPSSSVSSSALLHSHLLNFSRVMDRMTRLCKKYCPDELLVAQGRSARPGLHDNIDDPDQEEEEEEEEEED
jgi:hypothetical protein